MGAYREMLYREDAPCELVPLVLTRQFRHPSSGAPLRRFTFELDDAGVRSLPDEVREIARHVINPA